MTSTLRSALALAGCLLLAACEDEKNHGIIGPGDDVYGVWELDEPETLYLEITPERIRSFHDTGDCFEVTVVDIVDREGDHFTLDVGGVETLATIRREGANGLYIETEGDDGTYTWTNVNLASLTTC